jgi:hypothetical protein
VLHEGVLCSPPLTEPTNDLAAGLNPRGHGAPCRCVLSQGSSSRVVSPLLVDTGRPLNGKCGSLALRCFTRIDRGGRETFSRVDEMQNGRHHLVQRHRCSNFVTGHPAQHRLNGFDIVKETTELLRVAVPYELLVFVAKRSTRVSTGALGGMMWSNCGWNFT